jgi:hypothetical protein
VGVPPAGGCGHPRTSPRSPEKEPREEARPQIVCLCGSTRFAQEFRVVNRDLTLAGAIVVNPGGCIGESTRREIGDAHQTGKPVECTDAPDSAINSSPYLSAQVRTGQVRNFLDHFLVDFNANE